MCSGKCTRHRSPGFSLINIEYSFRRILGCRTRIGYRSPKMMQLSLFTILPFQQLPDTCPCTHIFNLSELLTVLEGGEEYHRDPLQIRKLAKAFWGAGTAMLFLLTTPMMAGERHNFLLRWLLQLNPFLTMPVSLGYTTWCSSGLIVLGVILQGAMTVKVLKVLNYKNPSKMGWWSPFPSAFRDLESSNHVLYSLYQCISAPVSRTM